MEKRLRTLFIDDFYNNFSGDFSQYRDILLRFDKNYRKICRLKLRFGPSGDKILLARSKELLARLKGFDAPLKTLIETIVQKEESDREAYRKFNKIDTKTVTK